jgi:predicted nucleotidyltransferase
VLIGIGPDDEERRIELRRMTLVIAVKPDCDGCRDFLRGDLRELSNVDVVIVSAVSSEEWVDAPNDVLVAPELMKQLDIRSAPFYVLIDPSGLRVVTEGVVFGPSQVAAEIAGAMPN